MLARLQNRRHRGATNMMLLANPASGVPLAHNAAHLKMFFSPRSLEVATDKLISDRGDIILNPPSEIYTNIEDDGFLVWSGSGDRLLLVNGSYYPISATSDALMIMSGRHTHVDLPVSAEPPSMTFRPGNGNAPTVDVANIRLRSYFELVGDDLTDSTGVLLYDPDKISIAREYLTPAVATTIDLNKFVPIILVSYIRKSE